MELARADVPVQLVMDRIGMASSTWYRRMRNPNGWTLGELDAVAEVLRIDRTRLTDGAE